MKALITTLVLCATLNASQPTLPPKAGRVGRTECTLADGLCVPVPPSWQRLGDIFDDLGFVVAEPQSGTDSATWPQLTVAVIDVPPSKDAGGTAALAPSLDALVEIVLTPGGSFTSAETLQRRRLILNGAAAEIVRVKLHDDVNKSEVIEEIALIEGEEGLVYSIALRCAPLDFARLEPVFQKAAHSWRIKVQTATPAPPPSTKRDSEKK